MEVELELIVVEIVRNGYDLYKYIYIIVIMVYRTSRAISIESVTFRGVQPLKKVFD